MELGVKSFSKLIGISHASLSQTENNKTITSAQTISNLVQNTNINIYWLCTGEGEMLRGDEKGSLYNKVEKDDLMEFKVSDALTMAARVLESDTSYATALYLNIQHFDRAIQAETRIVQLEERQQVNDKRILALETQVEKLIGEQRADRRKEERRQEDLGPPDGLDRRSGEERRAM